MQENYTKPSQPPKCPSCLLRSLQAATILLILPPFCTIANLLILVILLSPGVALFATSCYWAVPVANWAILTRLDCTCLLGTSVSLRSSRVGRSPRRCSGSLLRGKRSLGSPRSSKFSRALGYWVGWGGLAGMRPGMDVLCRCFRRAATLNRRKNASIFRRLHFGAMIGINPLHRPNSKTSTPFP